MTILTLIVCYIEENSNKAVSKTNEFQLDKTRKRLCTCQKQTNDNFGPFQCDWSPKRDYITSCNAQRHINSFYLVSHTIIDLLSLSLGTIIYLTGIMQCVCFFFKQSVPALSHAHVENRERLSIFISMIDWGRENR